MNILPAKLVEPLRGIGRGSQIVQIMIHRVRRWIMPGPYSLDLRKRILASHERGISCRKISDFSA
jgi:hypothetical protein